MNNPYVSGEKVYLRHPSEEDVEGPWYEWLSDEENTRWLNDQYWPNTKEGQKLFYESLLKSKDRLALAIVDIESGKHIGICSLSSINWVHRYCGVAIIMGDKDFRQGQHSLEAFSLLLKTAFFRLNMRIVKSVYGANNEASKAMHDVFRFTEVGRMPNLIWDCGSYIDQIISILTAETWIKRNAK